MLGYPGTERWWWAHRYLLLSWVGGKPGTHCLISLLCLHPLPALLRRNAFFMAHFSSSQRLIGVTFKMGLHLFWSKASMIVNYPSADLMWLCKVKETADSSEACCWRICLRRSGTNLFTNYFIWQLNSHWLFDCMWVREKNVLSNLSKSWTPQHLQYTRHGQSIFSPGNMLISCCNDHE